MRFWWQFKGSVEIVEEAGQCWKQTNRRENIAIIQASDFRTLIKKVVLEMERRGNRLNGGIDR